MPLPEPQHAEHPVISAQKGVNILALPPQVSWDMESASKTEPKAQNSAGPVRLKLFETHLLNKAFQMA